MSTDTTDQIDIFIKWIDGHLETKKWTDYRLSAEAGINPSVISKARKGQLPKWDALVKIANALGISPITAFRRAGLLPPGPDDKINFEDWQHLLKQMTPEEREDLFQIGSMRVERRKKEQSLKNLKTKKAG